ncbi:MAG: hypothetical protein RL684_3019 [Pseudomonadota bacterium]|jgi:hypothetical protein
MNAYPVRGRGPALLLLALFAAPLAFAFWLYYGSSWRPAGRTNHGELIQPVRPLGDVALSPVGGGAPLAKALQGKWSLVVVGQGGGAEQGCDATCRESLVYVRQTWLSMGRELTRLQRVLLAPAGCCDAGYLKQEHDGLLALDASGAGAAVLLAQFPAPTAGGIYVVDPLGNLMMRYDVHQDPKGLRLDLKKLLDLSHIG